MGLQNDAKKETYLSEDYLEEYTSMLRNQGLGASFRLMNVARGLLKLGLDFKPPGDSNSVAMQYGFFRRLTQFGMCDPPSNNFSPVLTCDQTPRSPGDQTLLQDSSQERMAFAWYCR